MRKTCLSFYTQTAAPLQCTFSQAHSLVVSLPSCHYFVIISHPKSLGLKGPLTLQMLSHPSIQPRGRAEWLKCLHVLSTDPHERGVKGDPPGAFTRLSAALQISSTPRGPTLVSVLQDVALAAENTCKLCSGGHLGSIGAQ